MKPAWRVSDVVQVLMESMMDGMDRMNRLVCRT